MRGKSLLQGALGIALLTLPAAAALSRQVVRYQIRADLDAGRKTIAGHETLTWRNDSADIVKELRFHLYLNAFRDARSSFTRESGGQLRGDRAQGDSGYVKVTRLEIAGGPDLTGALRFVHPDDDNAEDRTVASVALPLPVDPGASITLNIDFVSKLPKVFARTGYHNNFFMAGQWFPKIGVWRDGTWNCHQFHADTEFFADYGTYDVSLAVPAGYVVGATGVEQSLTHDAAHKRDTHRFYQEDVHDFAWTASPNFLRVERMFDPAQMVTAADIASASKLLGLSVNELRLKPVRMILLMQPEHRAQIERHFRALENAIKWFGLWYGPYPYDTITVVDPEFGANGAGGMEYPTLITAGTDWWPAANDGSPEEVIIHEFGHQYWYGMVGTNEFEESWLDEGFNTYSTGKVLDVCYGMRDVPQHFLGIPVARLLGLPQVSSNAIDRSFYLRYRKLDPVVRNAWQYYNSFGYEINSYFRPALVLHTLENYLGAPVMARIMRAWFQRYRFEHPTSKDFERLASDLSGQDLNWFFSQFIHGTNRLNYRVASVDWEPPQGKSKDYRITVKLERTGEAMFPVEMKMTLENGAVVRQQWDGRDRWVKYEYTRPAAVRSVEIDPEHKVLLDESFADNSLVMHTAPLPFSKWASNIFFWLEMVLP